MTSDKYRADICEAAFMVMSDELLAVKAAIGALLADRPEHVQAYEQLLHEMRGALGAEGSSLDVARSALKRYAIEPERQSHGRGHTLAGEPASRPLA